MEVIEDDVTNHFTICECTTDEHVLRWRFDPGEPTGKYKWPDEVYLTVYLTDYPYFWKRLWFGLRYAFGYKSKYGAFDVTIVSKPEAQKLVDFLQNNYLKQPSPKD